MNELLSNKYTNSCEYNNNRKIVIDICDMTIKKIIIYFQMNIFYE